MKALTANFMESKEKIIISLKGEIDHHSVKEIRNEIDKKILDNKNKIIYLEMKDITFMDSSGLGLILGRYNLIQEFGGTLKILNPCNSVKKMLFLADTEKIIPIECT